MSAFLCNWCGWRNDRDCKGKTPAAEKTGCQMLDAEINFEADDMVVWRKPDGSIAWQHKRGQGGGWPNG